MSINHYTHRIAESLRQRHHVRVIERAIASAPTPASRQEIELLARR